MNKFKYLISLVCIFCFFINCTKEDYDDQKEIENDPIEEFIIHNYQFKVEFNRQELCDVSNYFVITDIMGNEIINKLLKPIDLIDGYAVDLHKGKYIINYNHSKYSGTENRLGKTFAVLDTLEVSTTGKSTKYLNFKNAYYTIKVSTVNHTYANKIEFVYENNRGNISTTLSLGQISFNLNGYDPYFEKIKGFKYLYTTASPDPNFFSTKKLFIYNQFFEPGKPYMTFSVDFNNGIKRL